MMKKSRERSRRLFAGRCPVEIMDGDTWQHWEIVDQTENVDELYARHEAVERLRRAICRLQPTLRNVIEIHQSNSSCQGNRGTRRNLYCRSQVSFDARQEDSA